VISNLQACPFFKSGEEEWSVLDGVFDQARHLIRAGHAPDGYNFGINGEAGDGQTASQLHIHICRAIDVMRQCMRWLFPEKADYRSVM
jgi:hypothetical protein